MEPRHNPGIIFLGPTGRAQTCFIFLDVLFPGIGLTFLPYLHRGLLFGHGLTKGTGSLGEGGLTKADDRADRGVVGGGHPRLKYIRKQIFGFW